jgi:hypothetical protein
MVDGGSQMADGKSVSGNTLLKLHAKEAEGDEEAEEE